MLTLNTWLRQYTLDSSTVLFGKRLHFKEWRYMLYLFEGSYLDKLFGIFLYWESCLLSLICLFIWAFLLSVWTYGYPFSTLGYNPILCYFIVQTVPALANGSTSLLSVSQRCSRLIWCISRLGPRISHFSKKPSSFY